MGVNVYFCCKAAISLIFLSVIACLIVTHAVRAESLIRVEGIEIPVSPFKAKRGGKPTSPTYYGYHFKPVKREPSPYLIFINSSKPDLVSKQEPIWKTALAAQKRGYGVIVMDINRGVDGTNFMNGLVQAPPRSIGALSFLKYVIEEQAGRSNGKFGAWGRSKGGTTAIEINKADNQNGAFFFRNVTNWFDAVAAHYPTCGRVELVKPTLVMIGEADTWTSPANCRSWQKAASTDKLDVKYYDGATHSFDQSAFRKPTVVRGFTVQYNEGATNQALNDMFNFFDSYLKFDTIGYKRAQEILNEIGYQLGTPDGAWGPRSIAAMKNFQADKGLQVNGLLDEDSNNALLSLAP